MSNKFINFSLFLLAAVVAVLLILGAVKSAFSTGKIDYCYVENISGSTGGYEVIGHRPWKGKDAHLGAAGSPEAANELIKNSVICPK